MAGFETPRTKISANGRITLPKAIRRLRNWDAGTRLVVEDTPDGVLLKPASTFPRTRPGAVFAMLSVSGAPKSLDEMDAAVLAELRRCHDPG